MVNGKANIASLLLGIMIVLATRPLRAELDDLAAEERVKKLTASTLDPALPKESLAAWITRVAGPKGKVFWEVNDCGGANGGAPAEGDAPACVQASLFVPDGREFGVLISVGTWEKGFVGTPRVKQVYWAEGQQTHKLKRLSQIPTEIKNGPADADGDSDSAAEAAPAAKQETAPAASANSAARP